MAHSRKLDRALEHMKRLDIEIGRWLESEPYVVTDEFDTDRREHVVRVKLVEKISETFSPLIGDAVHSLRSALDHIAYELAERHTGSPLPPDIAGKSEFPIYGNRTPTAKELAKKIGAIEPGARKIIEDMQPHLRPDYARDPLWMIHELDRIDKHRHMHLVLLAKQGTSFGADASFDSLKFAPDASMESAGDEAEVGSYVARRLPTGEPMYVEFAPTVLVAFGDGPPAFGEEVVELLDRLRLYVINGVLVPLATYF